MGQSRAHQVTGLTIGQRPFFVLVAGHFTARGVSVTRGCLDVDG